jgi:uncharacterized membrane protein
MNKRRLGNSLGAVSLSLGTAQLVAPGAVNRLIGTEDDRKTRTVQRWLGGGRELAAGMGLRGTRQSALWLWTRVAGDALDLGMLGSQRARRADTKRRATVATAAVAALALADLAAAVATSGDRRRREIHADGRITVNRPVGEVYRAWRNLENLPRFMVHLESVHHLGDGRSRWRAAGGAGIDVEWEAEIDSEHVDEHISWRSVGEATVRNSGRVDFRPAPGRRGTEIRVHLTYEPPGGKLGAGVATLFGEAPDQQLRDDLRRFKQMLETGEVVLSEGSPEGAKTRTHITERPAQPLRS